MDKEWIETLRFPRYYLKKGNLEKYNPLTPFLIAALISRDQGVHVSVSEEELFHIGNKSWKADVLLKEFSWWECGRECVEAWRNDVVSRFWRHVDHAKES